MSEPLTVFIVTGEHSGDTLGGRLMAAMKRSSDREIVFEGLGGEQMIAQGLETLFPLDEVTVMGPLAILKQYPRLRRRALECVEAGVRANPDLVIIIDAPEFTHPIAKRIRKRRPDIPIVNYVSPSVWAWRPGRAKKMRPYVDHLLALLPFEPEAHERLGGPPCTYVGHPLVAKFADLDALDTSDFAARHGLDPTARTLLVLPGSRTSELDRLLTPFRQTVERICAGDTPPRIVIPTVAKHVERLRAETADWPGAPVVVTGEADKWAAFKRADAALAASGTVTLELAIAGCPMVVAYKVDPFAATLRFLVNVPSIVLANLVLASNAFPEFIQEDCEPERMAAALGPLLDPESTEHATQREALAAIRATLLQDGVDPGDAAAAVVFDVLKAHGRA
jgi:lipid-A-disaccharide synthase